MRTLRVLFTLSFVLAAPTALAQRNWDNVEITTIEVADGIYMLTGAGGNLGLSIGEDGAFLIDDQFAPLSAKIMAAVEAAGGGQVRFVLNTHWHGDHTGGNEAFGEAGAMIVAHDNVRRRMDPGTFTDVMGNTGQAPDIALPVVTYTDEVSFWWNGEHIHTQHIPAAHTDGDSVVWFRNANVVHMGDNFFAGMLPFIDVDSGGNVNGMIAAADAVLAQADENTRIIPGHGALASVNDLQEYRAILVDSRDKIQAHIDAGDSLEATVAANPLGQYADRATGFMPTERFVTLIYRSLTE